MRNGEGQRDVGHVYLFIFASKEAQAQDKISHDRSEMRSLKSAGERCALHGASCDRPHGRSCLRSSWTTVADGEMNLCLPNLLYFPVQR